ncbi:MAG: exosortase E/protease, VPEID-CTERM system [Candidatus Binatia bacterium]|jgi:exosortase E/protease (VPEID-CTERM system)
MPLVRWIALGILLLTEGIVLSVRFEAPDLGDEWWALLVSHMRYFMQFSIVGATATVLLTRNTVRRRLRHAVTFSHPNHAWPLLLAHFGAFAALYYVTARVLEGDLRLSSQPGLWVALWLLTGLVTITLCLATALPLRAWWPLTRAAAGPLLVGTVVGAAAFATGWLTSRAWQPLAQLTLWAVDRMITLTGAAPVTDPVLLVVGTQQFSVKIAPQCSGYEAIGILWVFLGAYLGLFRRSLRFPQVLLLFPAGTLLMWLLNALRIAALIAVGTWLSPSIALGGFHSYSGWLLFCGATLGLVAATQHSRFFALQDVPREEGEMTNPTAAYLAPLVVLVVVTMVTGAFSAGGFEALYPLRVVAVGAALWLYRREQRALRWTGSFVAVAAGIVVFVLWTALEGTRTGVDSGGALAAGLAQLPAGVAGTWLVFRVVGAVITVPVAEELAFRGYLMRRLMGVDFEQIPFRQFSWLALLGSSLAFGAMHQRMLAGTLAGGIYALVLLRRGELSDAVLAHATTNALLAAYALIAGNWGMWG